MVISAVQRPSFSRAQTWLIANWPAALWLAVAVAINAVGWKEAPESYRQAVALTDIPEADRAEMRRSLAGLHLSPIFLAWFEMATDVIGAVIALVIGWLLIRKAPRTRFSCFLAFVLMAQTNANYPPSIPDLLPGQPVAQAVARATTVVAVGGFFLLPFVFPDGRFVPRWTVLWGAYVLFSMVTFAFVPSFPNLPTAVEAATTVLLVLSALGSVVYRYLRVSTPDQRRQTRWVMLGLIVAFPGFFAGDAMMRNIGPGPVGLACLIGFLVVMPIAFSLPPVTLGIAILRHNLFDIDVVLSRTLAWLIMTAAVIGTYIGVVLGIGSLIGSRRSLLLSLLATGLVAVGFQPLRLRVQQVINRLLFGERDDPYAVLTRLGHHIEDSLSAADLLPAIVRTTAEMLRLPYAALFLDHADGPVLVASSGVASASTLRLPLTYQGQSVGMLEVAPRSPGEVFGQADRRLLEDLARQIGVAARTVSLATDLQHSRERIVTSREEERRRLRRDLHDGLGAQLAALIMQTGTARTLLRSDPDAADQKLADLREELRAAVAEVRRLVLGLRPPALDELGLIGALRTRLARLDRGGIDADSPALQVRVDADEPLPPMSAAAEVAAFRIVEEAVTNVVKHARADRVTVTIRLEAESLLIAVADDGIGITPAGDSSGIGLQSIRERATELGGTFAIGSGPENQGTLVRVTLPIAPAAGG
ncbi:MAG TPA: GAF domain-containing sensor histidine kinase [Thermomicrobiales bacterium]|jgi:signal transduction histidine kinase